MTVLLEVNNIQCSYGDSTIVDNLSFHMQEGCIACLLGYSGCGKTTALRAIAGFQSIEKGEIRLNNQLISTPDSMVPPEKRGLGMVFQDYALFPHISVGQNIGFGLHKKTAQQREEIIQAQLSLVRMEGYEKRYPHELSGGQQQRVALARALAPKPKLLLLDEPFSNLDADMRQRLVSEVREILKSQGITTLFVTHDQNEAFAMSDQIGVMDMGNIKQWDTAHNLYQHPNNKFIAKFIGQGSFIPGSVTSTNKVQTPIGEIHSSNYSSSNNNTDVDVLLRPENTIITADGDLNCHITDRAFKGSKILYTLETTKGDQFFSWTPGHIHYDVGQKVSATLNDKSLNIFER